MTKIWKKNLINHVSPYLKARQSFRKCWPAYLVALTSTRWRVLHYVHQGEQSFERRFFEREWNKNHDWSRSFRWPIPSRGFFLFCSKILWWKPFFFFKCYGPDQCQQRPSDLIEARNLRGRARDCVHKMPNRALHAVEKRRLVIAVKKKRRIKVASPSGD